MAEVPDWLAAHEDTSLEQGEFPKSSEPPAGTPICPKTQTTTCDPKGCSAC